MGQETRISIYEKTNGDRPFITWMESLDNSVSARIKARIERIRQGNLGDTKSLGSGLNELRLQFGSGYRIYFGIIETEIVLLLCGGDKSSQQKDIKIANEYLEDYERRK